MKMKRRWWFPHIAVLSILLCNFRNVAHPLTDCPHHDEIDPWPSTCFCPKKWCTWPESHLCSPGDTVKARHFPWHFLILCYFSSIKYESNRGNVLAMSLVGHPHAWGVMPARPILTHWRTLGVASDRCIHVFTDLLVKEHTLLEAGSTLKLRWILV